MRQLVFPISCKTTSPFYVMREEESVLQDRFPLDEKDYSMAILLLGGGQE